MSHQLVAQQEITVPIVLTKHSAPVKALALSRDGKTIATGGDDRMIYFWDIQTGELVGNIENRLPVKALQFSGNDEILAACGTEIRLTDRSGRLIRAFGGYTTEIWSISYHAATKKVTAGSYSKVVRIWDYDTGKPFVILEGHEKSCLPVCFSPSGDLIATGSLDKSVRLWDASSGKQKQKLELHTENIFAVDFHPTGKYLVSASADKSIRLWNVESGKIINTFTGHTGAISDVRFSADGNHLVSCASDRTIILWETATGNKLYSFTGHTGMLNAVRISQDGRYIVSVSDDQTVRIWPLDKKCFVDFYYGKEIEQAMAASPLFGPRQSNESRQAFEEREKEAVRYKDNLYSEYYRQYTERISRLSPEDLIHQ